MSMERKKVMNKQRRNKKQRNRLKLALCSNLSLLSELKIQPPPQVLLALGASKRT
jgi:hypothetical protein